MQCSEKRVNLSAKYFILFLSSLGVTTLYYLIRVSFGVSLDHPTEFPTFVTVMMIFSAITILFFIWWTMSFLACNSPDASFLFQDEVNYLIRGYYALAGASAAGIFTFLYSQFRFHTNKHFLSTTGFSLPEAAYGGKRKHKHNGISRKG
jgi:hypothetical protein